MKRASFLKCVAGAMVLTAAYPAIAQDAYPTKPIRFVVPYPPGGPTDLMARLLQPELQNRLGVPVVVENKSGAGGNVGSADVAKLAPADGHTILLAASGPMAVNPSLFKNMSFDPMKDLTPVIQISSFPLVLEVNPAVGVKTVKELVAMAKRPDSKLSFASAGNGTPQHLAGEIFNTQMGVSMTHIPYRGAGPALIDMLGGQVNVMFDVLGSSLPHIQSGRLIPLAVTSAKRHPFLPDVPTMMEAGIDGYEFTAWHGIAMRQGTPAAVVTKLNSTLNAIFGNAEFQKKWEALGTPVVGGSPQQFGDLIRKDSIRLGEVVKRAGVTVD